MAAAVDPTELDLLVLRDLQRRDALLWVNPALRRASAVLPELSLSAQNLKTAESLLYRWAAPLCNLFPELAPSRGVIESPLRKLDDAAEVLQCTLAGRVWLKQDHALPVAGSIKARGGVFEVLCFADAVLRKAGLIRQSDLQVQIGDAARDLLSHHTICVGSTGNLGLSIGVMAAALGLRCVVHMSKDAKEWKKDRLRRLGVRVVEHDGDFGRAVAAGRAEAGDCDRHYFVDDENSTRLFLGYAVAALRLKEQLAAADIQVDERHPLFVYLPCGVGGSPGGITFGLKHVFGDAAHCFFAEPCASPAMLLRLAFADQRLSAYDIGLDNVTEADGLAVASASELVVSLVKHLVSGVFTVHDDELFRYVYRLQHATGIATEPSAVAGFPGPRWLVSSPVGADYLEMHSLTRDLDRCTHLLWTTGGSLVPREEQQKFFERGRRLEAAH